MVSAVVPVASISPKFARPIPLLPREPPPSIECSVSLVRTLDVSVRERNQLLAESDIIQTPAPVNVTSPSI